MMFGRDLGGPIWAFFSYQVFSDAVRGMFALAATRAGGTILWILMALSLFWLIGPSPKRPDGAQRAVADTACEKLLVQIPHQKDIYTVAVLPFERDYTSYVTDRLRDALAATGRYNVRDKGVFARVKRLVRVDPREVAGEEAVLKAGKRMGVDAVIGGAVPEFIQDGGRAGIAVRAFMLRVPGGEKLADIRVEEGLSKSLASPGYIEVQLRSASLMLRVALWTLVCLLLPLCLAFVVRAITARNSNLFNFLLLAAFVLANLALAVIILDVSVTTWRGTLIMGLLCVVSLLYNYAICSKVEELEK